MIDGNQAIAMLAAASLLLNAWLLKRLRERPLEVAKRELRVK